MKVTPFTLPMAATLVAVIATTRRRSGRVPAGVLRGLTGLVRALSHDRRGPPDVRPPGRIWPAVL